MTTDHLQRAQFYLQHSRPDQAIQEINYALGHDPNDAFARALLAFCLCEQKRLPDAVKQARWAVHCAPDNSYAHYALAYAEHESGRNRAAANAIQQALRLYPLEADYHALRAQIACAEHKWKIALEAAETGLQINSNHVPCTNLRALSLRNLGQRDHAAAVLETALARDPENPYTHVNRGYGYLQQGDHKAALEHFREALRLDPNCAPAREGIVKALSARNPVYRLMLRYMFFMSRLPRGVQFALLIGAWYVANAASSLSRANPQLAPYLFPARVGYMVFAFLAWTANPLFNVLLRFDPLGRIALTKQQWTATNYIVFCLLGVCSGLAMWLHNGSDAGLLLLVFSAFLMIPVSATFESRGSRRRRLLGSYAAALAVLFLVTLLTTAFAGFDSADQLFSASLLAFIAFTWIANLVPDR